MLTEWRKRLKTITSWLFQDAHKARARALKVEMEKAFTEHPEQTGETYLQHLWFTIRMTLHFLYVALVMLIHGLFPFLCMRTTSRQIELVYRIMKSRIPKTRREEIEREERGLDGADI